MADWKSELYRQAKSIGVVLAVYLLATLFCIGLVFALQWAVDCGVLLNVDDDNSSAPRTIWGALSGEEE